ncbi:MAG: tetraacyldisaccharide 4'-kinase, partial [Salinisphaera sp.]|nr:tetraacyldisaccharide 4'-kinase [Salinisphaera sp.]
LLIYAVARDAGIAVRDRMRGYGNGRLLPAGPLREPLGRLAEVDLDLVQGQGGDFWLEPGAARNLADCHREQPLAAFIGQGVHAVAGIGNPESFFATLRSAGLSPLPHIFPDHHRFRRADIDFRDDHPVLMTEKDAVKCHGLADQRHWAVPVTACFCALAAARVDTLLDRLAEMVT